MYRLVRNLWMQIGGLRLTRGICRLLHGCTFLDTSARQMHFLELVVYKALQALLINKYLYNKKKSLPSSLSPFPPSTSIFFYSFLKAFFVSC